MSSNAKARTKNPSIAISALGVVIGVIYFIAAAMSGHPGRGLGLFGVMLVFSVGIFVAGRYSETIRGVLDRRDERFIGIDTRASAMTGLLLVLVILGSGISEIANGRSGEPFTWLSAVGGIGYVVSVVVLRLRS